MAGGQWLTVHRNCQHGIAPIHHDLGRGAGRPVVDRPAHDLGGLGLYPGLLEHVTQQHPLPQRVPDQIATDRIRHARQRHVPLDLWPSEQVVERQLHRVVDHPADLQPPAVLRHLRNHQRRVDAVEVGVRCHERLEAIERKLCVGRKPRRRRIDRRQAEHAALAVDFEPLLEHSADPTGDHRDRTDPDRTAHETSPVDAHRLCGGLLGVDAGRRHHGTRREVQQHGDRHRGADDRRKQLQQGGLWTCEDRPCTDHTGDTGQRNGGRASPAHRKDTDADPDSEQDDECSDDEDDLVVGAECLDGPVLERLGDPVDEHLTDGNNRRRSPLEQAHHEFGRGKASAGCHEAQHRTHPSGPVRSLIHGPRCI